jgi:hypothetical protein
MEDDWLLVRVSVCFGSIFKGSCSIRLSQGFAQKKEINGHSIGEEPFGESFSLEVGKLSINKGRFGYIDSLKQ